MYTNDARADTPPVDWLAIAAYPHKSPQPRPARRAIAAAPHLRRNAEERAAFQRAAEAERRQAEERAKRAAADNYIAPDPADTLAFLLSALVGLCVLVAGISLAVGG